MLRRRLAPSLALCLISSLPHLTPGIDLLKAAGKRHERAQPNGSGTVCCGAAIAAHVLAACLGSSPPNLTPAPCRSGRWAESLFGATAPPWPAPPLQGEFCVGARAPSLDGPAPGCGAGAKWSWPGRSSSLLLSPLPPLPPLQGREWSWTR